MKRSRKYPVYHLVANSIEERNLFPEREYYEHFKSLINFYKRDMPVRFSHFEKFSKDAQQNMIKSAPKIISLIAYCLMPREINLVVAATDEKLLTKFIKRLFDSYTRHYNKREGRKGTLYQNTTKKNFIMNGKQLLQLTINLHLSPYSVGLVKNPEDWPYSSYREYLGLDLEKMCEHSRYLKIDSDAYKKLVEDTISL